MRNNLDELIAQCREGDIQAFKQIYDIEKEKVYNVCFRMHGNHQDAQDSAQDSFVTVYHKIKTFRGDSAFSTWFYRIIVNTCLNNIRRSKRHTKTVHLDETEIEKEKIIHDFQNTSAHMVLEQEILNLPTGYRTVFILFEVEGFTHDEIAEILNITAGTSKSQLHRAKKILKEQLLPFKDYLQ